MTAAEMIDWDLAISIGSRLAGSGPEVSRAEADAVVAELRDGATRSTGLVRDYTGLVAADHETGATAPLLVVDRPGWIRANAESFDVLLSPFVDKVTEKKGPPAGLSKAVGSRVTGAEIGAVLGFLGGKVLGQFDPFHDPVGRLLLVAPNIVHVEREIEADPHDFRLWVCLHEETHRVQFTAVPWMRDAPLVPGRAPVRDHRADQAARRRPQAALRGRSGAVHLAHGSGAACSRSSARPSSARSWTS